jgi:RNA polymerase sigma-70 factor (ECF subfamily)
VHSAVLSFPFPSPRDLFAPILLAVRAPLVSSRMVRGGELAGAGTRGADAQSELAALYREHADQVMRWALRLGGPGLDAEDVVHEVFLVVRRRLAEFRGDAKLTTWLYRITERVVKEQGRKQRLRRALRGLVGDYAEEIPPERFGPYESVQRQHAARLVYKALDGLPRNHRSVVILYELEGHSGEEIAELMGAKLATVWVWLHRGRAKFAERLRALGHGKGES